MKFKFVPSFLILGLVLFSTFGIWSKSAMAASLTTFTDTLSSENASAVSNHTISFVTPTGVTSGQTIILTFNNSTSVAAGLTFADIDLSDNGSPLTLAASPSGATWGVVRTSATVITFTNGTTAVTAGHTILIKIGTNASVGGAGVNQITNGTAGTTTLTVSGTFGDTGTAAMPIVANDVVTVTATVNPTITFSLSSNSVALGTLSTGSATSGSHTISAATNAPGGFAVTYNGPTLTSGSNTIPAYGALASSTPGTAGFGFNLKDVSPTTNAGTCTPATNYNTASSYSYVASTDTTITAETAPADCVFTATYKANISSVTPAGSYTAAITYIDTGTF